MVTCTPFWMHDASYNFVLFSFGYTAVCSQARAWGGGGEQGGRGDIITWWTFTQPFEVNLAKVLSLLLVVRKWSQCRQVTTCSPVWPACLPSSLPSYLCTSCVCTAKSPQGMCASGRSSIMSGCVPLPGEDMPLSELSKRRCKEYKWGESFDGMPSNAAPASQVSRLSPGDLYFQCWLSYNN